MDPISIALICTAVFGTVMVVSAFIRQIMISRDKQLNDEAQLKAFSQEVAILEKMRQDMLSKERFQAHYEILGENKNAVKNVDRQIEEIFKEKTILIERYTKLTLSLSEAIMKGEGISQERKNACDTLREEINNTMLLFDAQIKERQDTRSHLLGQKHRVEDLLLAQERERNNRLDKVFIQHAAILEKTFLRHIEHTELIATKGIDASTSSFKEFMLAPIQFLMQFFGRGMVPGITLVHNHTKIEQISRQNVARAEAEINDPEPIKNMNTNPLNLNFHLPMQRNAGSHHGHRAAPPVVHEAHQETEDTFLSPIS